MERVQVVADVRRSNDEVAAENKAHFEAAGTLAVNLMSAPGAGKTSVLGETIQRLKLLYKLAVIEGDLVTTYDADQIQALGVPAHQINTGTVCHLDARMVSKALTSFPPNPVDVLFIENVGNLVCPAEFDLGEHLRVMVFSVPEGAEKPKKYPLMFFKSHVVLLNKIDLLPYAGVDLADLRKNVLDVNPNALILPISCRTGQGLNVWTQWLTDWIVRTGRKALRVTGRTA